MIVAKMATFPPRIENLPKVLNSLLPQVDKLTVYCNEYEAVPKCLDRPKVITHLGEDLGDGGKLHGLVGEYTFLVDDDIIYPHDYAEKMVAAIDEESAIVGCHGCLLQPSVKNYFEDRHVLHFRAALARHTPVHLLGTGTLAFRQDYFESDLVKPDQKNMLDCHFAVTVQTLGKRMLSIRRPNNWLRSLESKKSLWDARSDGKAQTEVINRIKEWKTH